MLRNDGFIKAGLLAAGIFATFGLVQAHAGEGCGGSCYRKVVHPPVYSSVSETVMVQPGMTRFHHIPAEYQTVDETVMVRPEQTIAHPIPAQYGTVSETVIVAPASKQWQVSRDAYGQEIGCWVHVPAQYAVRQHTVVVQPGSVQYETIPAQYATRSRTVMVRPGGVQREFVPPVYAAREREVMVSPATAGWEPIGGHGLLGY